ncbi:alpha/beta fold hydrolase [Streptomyces tanashiensis]|uniref:Alpha/beta hydrolase n=1 Tax=Streptomyces tanashiensis TaxID=67367 RepID=A0ABY6R845_9ACTN|nr:alpha/beta hydrolase [Streptomyces tanashiensis]UZX26248.1 alpha/beta hydrolase [Streptomyces tanashiensis]
MMPTIPTEPRRAATMAAGRRLSFLDFGGPGRPLLALHGHFGEGRTFTRLARELGDSWRVIALDQRGHGYSSRPADFSRTGYVEDAANVLKDLGIDGAAVLGHSLGGVNAYQLAARYPGLVDALIVEDIGAEVSGDLSFSLAWPHRAPTRVELLEGLGPSASHLTDAVREYPDGWGLAFDPKDMNASQQHLNGDHWDDWLDSNCPALLIRGSRSRVLSATHAKDMAARRPRVQLVELPAGHTVHETVPSEFAAAVKGFLGSL